MIDEIMKEIDIKKVMIKLSSLDKNSPSYKEEYTNIIYDFINKVKSLIIEENIEIRVAILDLLFNTQPILAYLLLKSEEPSLIEAQLVLEKIKGVEIDELKNNLDIATTKIHYMTMMTSSALSNESKRIIDNTEKIYKILHNYLKDKNVEEENEKLQKNYSNFAKGLKDVHQLIFSPTRNDNFPHRSMIINDIFTSEYIDNEVLEDIYNNVMLKNNVLTSFDYSHIIKNNIELLFTIKGLFKKCNQNIIESMTDKEVGKDLFPSILVLIKKVIECNIDDIEGIVWFLDEIIENSKNNLKLKKYLENSEVYKKYYNQNRNKIYEDNLNKLLNGEKDIDEKILYKLGTNNEVKEKYDILLKKYIESDDQEYKKTLIIPLIVRLIEKEKEKYNLDFKTVFTSTLLNNNTLGSYTKETNTLYINPNMFKIFKDMDFGLASSVNTVFHEVRHAKQYKELKESKELNYDNLLMAIDNVLSENTLSSYYKSNYEHISFERDARECAYVDTMTFFRGYENMQNKVQKVDFEKYRLSDYIRKERTFNLESYQGIIEYFLESVNSNLSYMKKNNENINDYIKSLYEYPVIFEFFDLDRRKLIIKPKEEKFFLKKLNELEKAEDTLSKREQKYSINAFLYSIKVSEYMKDKYNYIDKLTDGYDENIITEVEENVGQAPRR